MSQCRVLQPPADPDNSVLSCIVRAADAALAQLVYCRAAGWILNQETPAATASRSNMLRSPSIASLGVRKPRPMFLYHRRPPLPTIFFVALLYLQHANKRRSGRLARCFKTTGSRAAAATGGPSLADAVITVSTTSHPRCTLSWRWNALSVCMAAGQHVRRLGGRGATTMHTGHGARRNSPRASLGNALRPRLQ